MVESCSSLRKNTSPSFTNLKRFTYGGKNEHLSKLCKLSYISFCLCFVLFWASLADRLGAASCALRSGGLGLGFAIGTSTKDLAPEASFASTLEFATATSLAGVGGLGTRTSLVDIWRIGAATFLRLGPMHLLVIEMGFACNATAYCALNVATYVVYSRPRPA